MREVTFVYVNGVGRVSVVSCVFKRVRAGVCLCVCVNFTLLADVF